MLSSGILDFAVGLVFTFLAMSLAAGAATEAFASFLKTRSSTLVQGVKDLLNDRNFTGLALELYRHGLINPRSDGSASEPNKRTDPAYIDPGHFAAALLEIIKSVPDEPAEPAEAGQLPPAAAQNPVQLLQAKVEAKMPDNPQIRTMLNGIIERAEGDEVEIRKALANWFDNAMDRVSGAYKRWAQVWSFVFALVIAALLNVSTIDIANQLWKQPVDTKMIAAISGVSEQTKLPDYLATLDTLPIGWPGKSPLPTSDPRQFDAFWPWVGWICLRLAGWTITAFATLFGAPFWFDTLQQVVRLKGSGPSPAEKKADTAASG
jgi:hypothetical protein